MYDKDKENYVNDPNPNKGNDQNGHNGSNGNHNGHIVKPATSHAAVVKWEN